MIFMNKTQQNQTFMNKTAIILVVSPCPTRFFWSKNVTRLAVVAWIRGQLSTELSSQAMAAHLRALEDRKGWKALQKSEAKAEIFGQGWWNWIWNECWIGNRKNFTIFRFENSVIYSVESIHFLTQSVCHLPQWQGSVRAPLGLQRIYGSHLLHTGRPKQAAEVLRSVAMEDPRSPGALNNLAVAEYRQGRMHAAIVSWTWNWVVVHSDSSDSGCIALRSEPSSQWRYAFRVRFFFWGRAGRIWAVPRWGARKLGSLLLLGGPTTTWDLPFEQGEHVDMISAGNPTCCLGDKSLGVGLSKGWMWMITLTVLRHTSRDLQIRMLKHHQLPLFKQNGR